MNKKSICLIFILIISVFLSSCKKEVLYTNNGNSIDIINFNKKMPESKFKAPEGEGVGLRICDLDGTLNMKKMFDLKNNETWDKFICLDHMMPESGAYKLLLFVDFKEVNYFVDGNSMRFFDFKMNPNQKIQIPVEIKNLSSGLHDVFFAIARNVDNKSLDNNFRGMTSINNMYFLRFNISVENHEVHYSSISDKFITRNIDALDGIFINKSDNSFEGWLHEEVVSNNKFNYFIHIGNQNDKKKYALISLYDWEQVNFFKNEKSIVFIDVDKNNDLIVPAEIQTRNKEGVFDLSTILIPEPFTPISKNTGNIKSSIRVGIIEHLNGGSH